MKVILLEDIKNVGKKGQVLDAKEGYARNFLFPKNLAVEANNENMRALERKNKEIAQKRQEEIENASEIAKALRDKKIIIKIKSGENGKLFGAVTNKEISAAILEQTNIDIDRKKVIIHEPIKSLGEVEVVLKLHQEVEGRLIVVVESL